MADESRDDKMTEPAPADADAVPQPGHGPSPSPGPGPAAAAAAAAADVDVDVDNDLDSLAVPAKRKRDTADDAGADDAGADDAGADDQDVKMADDAGQPPAPAPADKSRELVKLYFEVLTGLDLDPPILKRPLLPAPESHREPQAKRQKSVEPPPSSTTRSISDKVLDGTYACIDDVAADVVSAVKASLAELAAAPADPTTQASTRQRASRLSRFHDEAMALFRREKMYPKTGSERAAGQADLQTASDESATVLSVVGYAPMERRLFSSLPLSRDLDLSKVSLPPGISFTRVAPSSAQDPMHTLGDLFGPPRTLPPLQPPKQPKTQAKGNKLDLYHPHPTDTSRYRNNTYFNTRLSAGHYLDYSNAAPWWQAKAKQRERAQSLAGKKPSTSELEASEVESLFRGAFSSFAPCKDDSTAVMSANVAGRMWWQRVGQRKFQRMIEVDYYGDTDGSSGGPLRQGQDDHHHQQTPEVDEAALQEALDNWDDTAVDPTLEDVMGTRRDDQDKEADEILDEVTDLIETLASYQRIRNLSLPNSQNRPTTDPVAGDMLANAGPQPSEEEQATYHMLKAQLALIIKTLPPYAVAKLNGDQLDDLLISTRMMIQTDEYKGTMEEDEAGMQARLKAQQQAAAQAAQANARPSPQRTPSITSVPYPPQYQTPNHQYGTPSRAPAPHQQYYRGAAPPNYQQPRSAGPPPLAHTPRPQPNQYTRSNGYPNQYATQLAKAQTPYGHQSMPQYAAQQRPPPPYGQQPPPPSTPNARYPYQPQVFPHQQSPPPPPPPHASYGAYANGRAAAALPQRTMSPLPVGQRPGYHQGPAANMQQNHHHQRYGVANQQNPATPINRFPGGGGGGGGGTGHVGAQNYQSPGLVGYHTVIPESQQQRILEQAKARLAAQERSAAMLAQPGISGLSGLSYSSALEAGRLAAARTALAAQTNKPQTPTGQKPGVNGGSSGPAHVPHKVTPVPVPVIPGSQRKPAT